MDEGVIGLGYIYETVGRISEPFRNSSLNTPILSTQKALADKLSVVTDITDAKQAD